MQTKVYNLEGQVSGEMSLNEKVFGVRISKEVVHEVFVAQMNNLRAPYADTKSKGEVSGGGKKPWKQKGTGRARHGSSRSPIWRGGGVTFGPLSVRNYKTKINKATRRLATRMCLSDKLASETLFVVENFNFADAKTKVFDAFIKKLPIKNKTFLVLTGSGENTVVHKMSRNLERLQTMRAIDVPVVALVNTYAVVISKEAVAELEEVLIKKD